MPDLLDRITLDPALCGGRPRIRGLRIRGLRIRGLRIRGLRIRGLRIRGSDVLDLPAAEASTKEVLQDYPSFETDAIHAAVTRLLASEGVQRPGTSRCRPWHAPHPRFRHLRGGTYRLGCGRIEIGAARTC